MPWPRQRCKNASSAAVLAQNYTVSRSSIPKQASLLSFAMPCYNMVSSELTEARVQLRPSGVATKPHHVEATPPEVQLRPSVVAAKPGHVAATPLAVDERQLVLYRRMRSMLNLSTNENNAWSYIFRYGTLSEVCPFGERLWDGLQQDFVGYRFTYLMSGRRFLGWFRCPSAFSQHNAGRGVEPGDSVWYPAVFCDMNDEHVFMACLHIILVQCRPWKVHRTRMAHQIEMV